MYAAPLFKFKTEQPEIFATRAEDFREKRRLLYDSVIKNVRPDINNLTII